MTYTGKITKIELYDAAPVDYWHYDLTIGNDLDPGLGSGPPGVSGWGVDYSVYEGGYGFKADSGGSYPNRTGAYKQFFPSVTLYGITIALDAAADGPDNYWTINVWDGASMHTFNATASGPEVVFDFGGAISVASIEVILDFDL